MISSMQDVNSTLNTNFAKIGFYSDLQLTCPLPAVLNGELDTKIDYAANKLRDGFAQ